MRKWQCRAMKRLLQSSLLLGGLLGSVVLLGPHSAAAQSQKFAHGTLSLASDKAWIEPGQDFTIGLHFALETGWHIYWVNPGDSGEPPRVKWNLPAGVTAGAIEWPVPQKLGTASIVDFGYQGDVTLLVPMRSSSSLASTAQAGLTASINLLICRDMCIPGKTEASISLPVKGQAAPPDPASQQLFASARARLPQPAPESWHFSAKEEKDAFALAVRTTEHVASAYFFPLEESQITNAPQEKLTPQGTGFTLTLHKSDELTKPLTRLKGVLVWGDHAYLVDAAVLRSTPAAGAAPAA